MPWPRCSTAGSTDPWPKSSNWLLLPFLPELCCNHPEAADRQLYRLDLRYITILQGMAIYRGRECPFIRRPDMPPYPCLHHRNVARSHTASLPDLLITLPRYQVLTAPDNPLLDLPPSSAARSTNVASASVSTTHITFLWRAATANQPLPPANRHPHPKAPDDRPASEPQHRQRRPSKMPWTPYS